MHEHRILPSSLRDVLPAMKERRVAVDVAHLALAPMPADAGMTASSGRDANPASAHRCRERRQAGVH
jgi:hypothetical protein